MGWRPLPRLFQYERQPTNRRPGGFPGGLAAGPSVYDIYSNRDATMARFQTVVLAMLTVSTQYQCIYVSQRLPKGVCGMAVWRPTPSRRSRTRPSARQPRHAVTLIGWSTSRPAWNPATDPQTIYRSGFKRIYTLDPAMQDSAQQIVTNQVNRWPINTSPMERWWPSSLPPGNLAMVAHRISIMMPMPANQHGG